MRHGGIKLQPVVRTAEIGDDIGCLPSVAHPAEDKDVGTRPAGQRVPTRTAVEMVIAGAAMKMVIAGTAMKMVIATKTENRVMTTARRKPVVAIVTDDQIIMGHLFAFQPVVTCHEMPEENSLGFDGASARLSAVRVPVYPFSTTCHETALVAASKARTCMSWPTRLWATCVTAGSNFSPSSTPLKSVMTSAILNEARDPFKDKGVVTRPAGQPVPARTAGQSVVAGIAIKMICYGVADQDVAMP